MSSGLDEASAFLLNEARCVGPGDGRTQHPGGGFRPSRRSRRRRSCSSPPDGHSARYLVQTKLNPFSLRQWIRSTPSWTRPAVPSPTRRCPTRRSRSADSRPRCDTRDYYQHDIRLIIAGDLAVVLLTPMVLLRAFVAPLYLVGSVVISYFARWVSACWPSSSSSASSWARRRWRSWCWWRWAPTQHAHRVADARRSVRSMRYGIIRTLVPRAG